MDPTFIARLIAALLWMYTTLYPTPPLSDAPSAPPPLPVVQLAPTSSFGDATSSLRRPQLQLASDWQTAARPIPALAEPTLPDETDWLYLGRFPIRYYGSRFTSGRRTASALPYRRDAPIASMGTSTLQRLRQLPPDLVAGRQVCRSRSGPCEPWGYHLRIVDAATGRAVEVALEDTGAHDGVDLPDAIWRQFGYGWTRGQFWGDVWVKLE